MTVTYTITDTALNQITQFIQFLDRLASFSQDAYWKPRLRTLITKKQAFSAIAIGMNMAENSAEVQDWENAHTQFPAQYLQEYTYYREALDYLWNLSAPPQELTVEELERLYKIVSHDPSPRAPSFRNSQGLVTKVIWEHGIKKIIDLEVETKSSEIASRVQEFLDWYNQIHQAINPVILAAIAHLKVAEIHPYPDANGRLSRLISRYTFLSHGFPQFLLVAPEYYFYIHREQYYEEISKAISSHDLSEWLEFYAKALHVSVHGTFSELYKMSGGSINLLEQKQVHLTDREVEMIEVLTKKQQASAAEVGEEIGVSRQNANVILKRLVTKGLLTVIGRGTSSRYTFASS